MFTTRRANRSFLAATMAAAAFGTVAGPAAAQTAGGPKPSTEEIVVQGIFGAAHADPTDERSEGYLATFVSNERAPSQSTAISFPPALVQRLGGLDVLAGKRVAVRATSPTRGRDRGTLTAAAVDVQGDASKGLPLSVPPGTTGTPKPVLTVLCRFKDKAAQPQMQPYFEGLAGSNSIMDTYFRQTSYDQINLGGSKIAPAAGNWYELPNNQADYINDEDGKMLLGKLYEECSAKAAADFNLDDFAILNLAFNNNLVTYSFGGFLDGRKVTWLPPKGWMAGGTVAHELGHAMYMDHTGLAGSYDNQWDVLSSSGSACTPIATYACMQKHQSAYNKNEAGWLNGRIVNVPEQATTTVDLQPLDSPGTGPVLARIAPTDPVAKHAYLVEFRRPVGLDAKLPFAGAPGAVIIYETWEEPAPTDDNPDKIAKRIRLMGSDGGAGARWLAGMVFDREKMFTGNFCDNNDNCTKSPVPEAFDYEIDGIRIRVDSISATKAMVTFTQLPRIGTLQAGPSTPSSYEVHWVDSASTETFFKISYSNNKTSGEVIVPANATSYTFHNAPAGVDFVHQIQACNGLACGPGGNSLSAGADPLPLKNK
ncbi:MAG: hypothetical protein ACRD2W_14165 [Acidimicrobiales bacterium]